MENSHIVKSFDQELIQIESLILQMGGLVEIQITESITALCNRDMELAAKVRNDDEAVDLLETEIDEMTLRTLALRQPVASDLRGVICALKVASNLERIGDYAKNIAKRTGVFSEVSSVGSAEKTIQRMGDLVQRMVGDVLNAYVDKDVVVADELLLRDKKLIL